MVTLLLSGTVALRAAAQSYAAMGTYPETSDGLKKLLHDVFTAEQAGDPAKVAQFYADFAIPNHTQWFLKTFGEKEGANLDAKYSQNLEGSTIHLRGRLTHSQAQGKTGVTVEAFAKPEEAPTGSVKAFGSTMITPTTIYHAVATNGAEEQSRYLLGDFVYVDGGFRYVDLQVMQALSTAPPMRVRIAGTF
jgi:hypothetical protein